MQSNLILSVLGFLLLTGCNSTEQLQVSTTPVTRPPLVVQDPDTIVTRPIEWVIVTPSNIEQIFASLPEGTALFAVTADGYSNLSLNLSDTRALVEQQAQVIAAYRDYYE